MSSKVKAMVKAKAARARVELMRTWDDPSPFEMPEVMKRWHTKYTRLICEFMCERLSDERLVDWRLVFTGIHELVAHAFEAFMRDGVRNEGEAWDAVWPEAHYALTRIFTLNPPGVAPEDFIDEHLGFFAYLADRDVIGVDVARRLDARYRAAHARAAA
jgi:hypothetical protein